MVRGFPGVKKHHRRHGMLVYGVHREPADELPSCRIVMPGPFAHRALQCAHLLGRPQSIFTCIRIAKHLRKASQRNRWIDLVGEGTNSMAKMTGQKSAPRTMGVD